MTNRIHPPSRYVVTTGKGQVWIVVAQSEAQALTRFQKEYEGVQVASIIKADGLL